ncbi:MAG TPA: hypothetical protein VI583_13955, partial [Cyclobacteriaceae bacterium]|nr:hypothetical protein [Cyclobacteriaceae bacterium]
MASIKLLMVSISMTVLISPVFAQEYDDMYFSHSDRKLEIKKATTVAKNTEVTDESTEKKPEQYGAIEDNYSAKNINPEYIARYRDAKDASEESTTADDSYYVEEYERSDTEEENDNVTNNYYGYPHSYSRFNRWSYYDPFWGSSFYPGWSYRLGYGFGYMPGWSFALSYGNMWGYGSYYSPWSSWYYDPWDSWGYSPWSSYYGYSSWYYPSYYRSYSRFGYFGNYYNCYSCYFYGHNDSYANNNVSYGRRSFRSSGTALNTSNDNTGRQLRTVDDSRRVSRTDAGTVSSGRTRVSSQRDYSARQNEYYSRTRSTGSTGTSYGSSRTYSTPTSDR